METIVVLAENEIKEKLKRCFSQLLIVVEAENEWHLPYLVRDLSPHCVLLDTTHPARNPDKIVSELKEVDEELPIIAIISKNASRPVSLIEKGIQNTISFPCSQAELVWTIQQAIEVFTLRKLTPKIKARPASKSAAASLYH